MNKKLIFISYSVKDKTKVAKIKKDIESIGHTVWIYPQSISPGDFIPDSEKSGIEQADYVLIMMSKKSSRSRAVQEEIAMAKSEEQKTGKKKLFMVKIDSNMTLKYTDAIQITDLSNRATYTREFYRLFNKIESHRNYSLESSVISQDSEWFYLNLELKGANLDFVKSVDYHLHPLIMKDDYTVNYGKKRKKKFSIKFYTDDNEIAYAIVVLRDGTTEELRHFVKL